MRCQWLPLLPVCGVLYLGACGGPAGEDEQPEPEGPTTESVTLHPIQRGGNTLVTWRCGKVQLGLRYDYEGAWRSVAGEVVLDRAAGRVLSVTGEVVVSSMEPFGFEHRAPPALIARVIEDAFDPAHPTATLRLREPVAIDATSWPVTLTINGTTADLDATVEAPQDASAWRVTLVIDRVAFAALLPTLPGVSIDDRVTLTIEMDTQPGRLAYRLMDEQAVELDHAAAMLRRLDEQTHRLAELEEATQSNRRGVARLRMLHADDWPAHESVWLDQHNHSIETVLIRPANGEPFYLQTTEIKWTDVWAMTDEAIEYREGWGDASRGWRGRGLIGPDALDDDAPAIGMTPALAEAYCDWLGKQTGRVARLPTEAEWEAAHDTGAISLVGGVAEWVTTKDGGHVVRGGHDGLPADELDASWRAEPSDDWYAHAVHLPHSPWWYSDAVWTGFRVVFEP